MSVNRYMYVCKVLIIITIVNFAGCSKSKQESDSINHLNIAKEMLMNSSITNDNLRLAENHLKQVDDKSTSYNESRKLLSEVQTKISTNDNIEYKAKERAIESRKKASPQMRITYAQKYKVDYDRIQVGSKATATGKGNRILNIYLKYYFDDLVQKNSRYYIHNQWFELGFNKVIFYDATGYSWETEITERL